MGLHCQLVRRVAGTLGLASVLLVSGPFAAPRAEAAADPRDFSLLADVNAYTGSSAFTDSVEYRGLVYFAAPDGVHGYEPWRTDGTQAGTVLVKDINPGSSPSSFSRPLVVNDAMLFSANNGTTGNELWKSDGTEAGTVMVKDINPGSGDAVTQPSRVSMNGTLFFSADDGTNGTELWKSDGTEAGTVIVQDVRPGSFGSDPGNLINVNGTLFFHATDASTGRELWKSDGTGAGTVIVQDIRPGSSSAVTSSVDFAQMNGVVYFQASDGASAGKELWKSDGTAAGTSMVKDIRVGGDGNPESFFVSGSTLFFKATTALHGTELWKTDGSTAGTTMVRDVNAISSASTPSSITPVGSQLFFSANDGTHGRELWVTDGTPSGVRMVKDICTSGDGLQSGSNTSNDKSRYREAAVESRLFFLADDCATSGNELWVSDGTASGTTMVADLAPGSNPGDFASLTAVGSRLFFFHESSTSGWELWVTDGTSSGTQIVKDINPGAAGSTLQTTEGLRTHVVGDDMYFVASDGTHGYELWKSNGTAAGTTMVADLASGTSNSFHPSSARPSYAHVGSTLFFVTNDGQRSRLWKTDGTASGTIEITAVGSTIDQMSYLTTLGSVVYFAATDGVRGLELWKTDGTSAGTTLVSDVNPGAAGSIRAGALTFPLYSVESRIYFVADDGLHGAELWSTDGTSSNTRMVVDAVPGNASSEPEQVVAHAGSLFFVILDTDEERRLWRHDSNGSGVVDFDAMRGTSVGWLRLFDGKLFLRTSTSRYGNELWALGIEQTPDTGSPDDSSTDPNETATPSPPPAAATSTESSESSATPSSAASPTTTAATMAPPASVVRSQATPRRSASAATRDLPATGLDLRIGLWAAFICATGLAMTSAGRRFLPKMGASKKKTTTLKA